jgi:hypothetical protein
MFKQLHKDTTKVDVDDEDKDEKEVDTRPWQFPMEIDFSSLDGRVKQENYARFGGSKEPNSTEKIDQAKHESSTLMAVYFTKADIPPSPREPINPHSGIAVETIPFGIPDDKYTSRGQSSGQAGYGQSNNSQLNIDALLGLIQGPPNPPQAPAQPVQAPVPPPSSEDQFSGLFDIFKKYTAPPQTSAPVAPPAVAAPTPASVSYPYALPAPQVQVPPQTTWAQPPYVPPAPVPPPQGDFNALLATLSGFTQAASQPQITAAPPPVAPALDMNVQNLLATLGLGNLANLSVPQQPTPPAQVPYQQPAPAQAASSGGDFIHPDRKRIREQTDDYDGRDDGQNKRHNNANYGAKKFPGKPRGEFAPRYTPEHKKFKEQCKYFPMGKCKKGADCTYLHT